MPDSRSTSPTTTQGVLGTAALVGLAAIPTWWATDEPDAANRAFLWALAALLGALAVWRGLSTARTAMKARRASRR